MVWNTVPNISLPLNIINIPHMGDICIYFENRLKRVLGLLAACHLSVLTSHLRGAGREAAHRWWDRSCHRTDGPGSERSLALVAAVLHRRRRSIRP